MATSNTVLRPRDGTRVLVIGRSGQVARALARAGDRGCNEYVCMGRPDIELLEPDTIARAIRSTVPHLVVNAAAYTGVDDAESEPDLAHKINADGPAAIALQCAEAGIPLIHLSTDYVFDGDATRPYRPTDPTNPRTVYGNTKMLGEVAITKAFDRFVILRSGWVYSEAGRNFVTTMLRKAGEGEAVSVVNDQRGTPTFSEDIAAGIDRIVNRLRDDSQGACWGIYHLANTGQTTWYEFALEIFRLAQEHGHKIPEVRPISSEDYPTRANRPRYSVLDTSATAANFGFSLPDWKPSLKRCMSNILEGRSRGLE